MKETKARYEILLETNIGHFYWTVYSIDEPIDNESPTVQIKQEAIKGQIAYESKKQALDAATKWIDENVQ